MAKNDLQGALDLLILKSLSQLGAMHGYGIAMHIEEVSDALLTVEEGSLYPALHRMEQSGWVRAAVGGDGGEPEGEVLLADGGGQEAACRAGEELGAGGEGCAGDSALCVR